MTERCDLSDLPVDQCACRIHGPKEPKPTTGSGRGFPAAYGGRCDVCGDRIHVGDLIAIAYGMVAGAWAHADCQG